MAAAMSNRSRSPNSVPVFYDNCQDVHPHRAPSQHLQPRGPGTGDFCVKSGYLKPEVMTTREVRDEPLVIKIAGGSFVDGDRGTHSPSGMMVLYSQITGQLEGILIDNCFLTDLRTAVAGALCAKLLAPKDVSAIGIVGTGVQWVPWLHSLHRSRACVSLRSSLPYPPSSRFDALGTGLDSSCGY